MWSRQAVGEFIFVIQTKKIQQLGINYALHQSWTGVSNVYMHVQQDNTHLSLGFDGNHIVCNLYLCVFSMHSPSSSYMYSGCIDYTQSCLRLDRD